MSDEEYQRRIDLDPTVKRLSARTVREREKEGLCPDERNPRGAGRKREPPTAASNAVTMRVPGELATDIIRLKNIYRNHPDFIREQLRELTEEIEIYLSCPENTR